LFSSTGIFLQKKTTSRFYTVVFVFSVMTVFRWESLRLLCGKFIQDTTCQTLSESSEFCRRYHKNIRLTFFL